jgi:hypothetical protein
VTRTVSATHTLDTPPDTLWPRLLVVERWPAWAAPVVERATPGPSVDLWTLRGVLGKLGYAGEFKLVEYQPGQRLYLESLEPSTPFDSIIHDLELELAPDGATLTWRTHYDVGGGPGGWLMATLATRRQLPAQLAAGLARLLG